MESHPSLPDLLQREYIGMAEAILVSKLEFERQLNELVDCLAILMSNLLAETKLTALWVSTYSGSSAHLEMFSNAPLPTISGIDEAYLAVVKAKDLVDNLLITEDGNLRTQVFEENVRSFLAILDNPVNYSIEETIKKGHAATRFPCFE